MYCLDKKRITYAKFDKNRQRLYMVTGLKHHQSYCNTQKFYSIVIMNLPKREYVCLQSLSNDRKQVINLARKMAKNEVTQSTASYIAYDWLCEQF